ncbi:MAG: class I SAM-dependent methyltransferase [Thermoplasmata archaeon]|nr:class I SAM-dependent methyltransferase [Thermoplasmata archaeon]
MDRFRQPEIPRHYLGARLVGLHLGMTMDREAWLAERRREVEKDYTRDGATYDEGYDSKTPLHLQFVRRIIELSPPDGIVLNAACGTGRYTGMVLEGGLQIIGTDQSQGMLARAAEKYPDVRFEPVGLQELQFEGEFDAAMCIDAMEHVPPEEWPQVLANLGKALHPGGLLYLTVEETDPEELDQAYEEARAAGLPALHGEDIRDGTGGYHFYPSRERVRTWLTEAGFTVLEDADEWFDSWGYHHLLTRAR